MQSHPLLVITFRHVNYSIGVLSPSHPKESTMWMTSRKTQNRHNNARNCAKPPVLMCLVLHVVKGGSIDFLCALQEFELSPLVNKTHLSLAFARKLGTIVYYNDRSWFQFIFSCMLVSLYTKVWNLHVASWIELEYYSVVYFKCITEFDVL